MKKAVLCGLVLALTVGLSGCGGGGNTPDGVTKDLINLLNETATVLDSVKDEASAKAAVTKLESISKRGEELKKRMDELKLSKDDEKKLQDKYKKEMEEAGTKLGTAMGKVTMMMVKDPKTFGPVLEAMKK